jgi:hypothetical protein
LWIEGATVFRIKDGKLNHIYWGGPAVSGRAKVADGKQHTVAVRFLRNKGWSFYVDGKLDFTRRGNSKDVKGQYFVIGTSAGWAGPGFSGKISCF